MTRKLGVLPGKAPRVMSAACGYDQIHVLFVQCLWLKMEIWYLEDFIWFERIKGVRGTCRWSHFCDEF
jgi:hypothetical protein